MTDQLKDREQNAADFIKTILGVDVPLPLSESLNDGVLLCKYVMMTIQPHLFRRFIQGLDPTRYLSFHSSPTCPFKKVH